MPPAVVLFYGSHEPDLHMLSMECGDAVNGRVPVRPVDLNGGVDVDKLMPFLSMIGAFAVVAIAGVPAIELLRRLKAGQPIRGEGPRTHLAKQGTPTMGGVLIWLGVVLASVPVLRDPNTARLVGLFLAYGLIGLADDMAKVVFKSPKGVPARLRLLLQLLFAATFLYLLVRPGWAADPNIAVRIWGSVALVMPRFLYIVIGTIVLAGTANAVNFTDGVDGLLSTVQLPTLVFFLFAGAAAAGYTGAVLIMAAVGALLGFLVFNHHPAKVFMGDTGSLALGALTAGMVFVYRVEILMPLLCLVYWTEIISVVIQVVSFKTRGVRVFKMSPIHHHFELSGWSETKVVAVFGTVSLLAAALAVLLYSSFAGVPLF